MTDQKEMLYVKLPLNVYADITRHLMTAEAMMAQYAISSGCLVEIESDDPGWKFGSSDQKIIRNSDCVFCNKTGYKIRIAFFEDRDRDYPKTGVLDSDGNIVAQAVEIPDGGEITLRFTGVGVEPVWVNVDMWEADDQGNFDWVDKGGSGNGPDMEMDDP